MTVFVSGGAGFIGQHVVRQLAERGERVRVGLAPGESAAALADLDIESAVVDVRDLAAVKEAIAGCDGVIHLAAIYKLWMRDYRPMYQVNVQGTRNVLDACAEAGVRRIVHTSSIAAVGVEAGQQAATEETAFNQHGQSSHYILSKHEAELVAHEFAGRGVPVTIVNPAFPFGVGDLRPTPTGRMVLRILVGTYFAYGPGGLNVVDVEDVARGHVAALDHGEVGRRYLLSGTNVDYASFFEQVCEVGGRSRRAFRVPRWVMSAMGFAGDFVGRFREPLIDSVTVKYSSQHLYFDCSRAEADLGYTVTPLDEVLDKSIAWFREHGYLERDAPWRMKLLGTKT
ncbi:MAG: NAD-dependent epimerase/dehydratase family protein [Proteobacteria bacterium]|nr:NAD-dependent epimerase/dehydratase family protein [Pseudomonadota bacterium]